METAKVVIVLLAFLLTTFGIYKHYFIKIEIPTSSMYPTIKEGSRITVMRLGNVKNVKRGDLLVFRSTEKSPFFDMDKLLIKRLIGMPNERVLIENGSVFIDGALLQEPYVKDNFDFSGEFLIPKDKYFFLGDNRPKSFDSRFWIDPFIESRDIIAKVLPWNLKKH